MFDPTDPAQVRFNGCGPSALPNKRDDEMDEFVARVVAGGTSAVTEVLPHLSEKGRQVLRAYADRMASLAIRWHDRATIVKALVALVLGGLDENRLESLMVMAPIEDSARRLGIDPPDLFEEVLVQARRPAMNGCA
jgi:hypothetical protein